MNEKSQKPVALVTGGTRGIGRAIVEELGRSGWKVAFTYRNNGELACRLTDNFWKSGVESLSCQADVRDYPRAVEVLAEVEGSLGPVDLLVNNAGIKRDKPLYRMEPEEWNSVIDTNLNGVFNYCRAFIYGMIKRQRGSIINMVSASGIIGLAGQTNYSASKAGVIGFTKALSREVARFNIRVNAVAPGFIETEMLDDIPEPARKKLYAQVSMGSPGSPSQVAQVVAFLAGEGSSYVTGQVLPVDGGMV